MILRVRFHNLVKDSGTTTIGDEVIDTIKPVIWHKLVDSLPIVYKKELSGDPPSGSEIPGWVL